MTLQTLVTDGAMGVEAIALAFIWKKITDLRRDLDKVMPKEGVSQQK